MNNILLIDSSVPNICMIAHLFDGKLQQVDYSSMMNTDMVGNIYLGRVVNALQSLSAYFIDYGVGKNGFLPFASVGRPLKRDEMVIIQVVKNVKDNKGARLSCFVKLHGKYSVYMPYGSPHHKESSEMTMVKQNNANYNLINADTAHLKSVWQDIVAVSMQIKTPILLREEDSLIHRILRDHYGQTQVEVHVDGHKEYLKVKQIVEEMELRHLVKEYKSVIPMAARFGIATDLSNLHSRSVELASGGSIVIDLSEAMVSIDINSSSCAHGDLEETSLKVNLEAALEIARQIRLRDLSGIIAIDFIDMQDSANLVKVETTFKNAMQSDRAMNRISSINEFGVLMLSRQRSKLNLYQQLYSKCNYCTGTGFVKTEYVLALDIINEIRLAIHTHPSQLIQVECQAKVAQYLLNDLREVLYNLERSGNSIHIIASESLIGKFTINLPGRVKPEDLIKFEHPIVVKRQTINRLMQDMPVFQSHYLINTSHYGMTITQWS